MDPSVVVPPATRVDKRAVLIVTVMACFLPTFMASSISVALPAIGRDFSASAVSLSWIVSAQLLSASMFLVPMGKFADTKGRRKVFLTGMLGYMTVSLLCAMATSENVLIALRVLQGFTDSMIYGISTALVTSVFPPKERGRALGINVASVYVGASCGPAIGGWLTHFLGWRSIFMVTATLGLTGAVLISRKIRGEWSEPRQGKFDVVGAVLYGATLLGVMSGLSALPALWGLWLVAAGAASLAGFFFWERRQAAPLLDVQLFLRNTYFAFGTLAGMVNYVATFAIGFMLSLYLQYVKGYDSSIAGMIILSQPIIMAVFSPVAGRLSDRFEARFVSACGMALTMLGLIQMAFLNQQSGLPAIVAALVCCGLGFALFSSPNINLIMSSVDRAIYGVASSVTAAFRLIGQMLSVAIASLIVAVYVGNVQVTPDRYPAFMDGFHVAFALFAAVSSLGLLACLQKPRQRKSLGAEVS